MNNALGFPYGFFTNDNTPQNAIYYKNFNNTTLPKVPYTDVAEANSLVVAGLRYKGLTVNINGNEYWWKDDITDESLVAKPSTATLSIDITNSNLITAITDSEIQIGVKYRVTDAIGGAVWIWGIDANVVSGFAVREGSWDGTNYVAGLAGTYSVSTNTFTEQGRIATAPTVNNDTLHGYYVGQLLTTLDTGVTYECTDATNGAAVWKTPSTCLVPFKLTISEADLLAGGGQFFISECPAMGLNYIWIIDSLYAIRTPVFAAYDENPVVTVGTDGATFPQFTDRGGILTMGSDFSGRFIDYATLGATTVVNLRKNNGLVVNVTFDNTPSQGSADLVIYGAARLVNL